MQISRLLTAGLLMTMTLPALADDKLGDATKMDYYKRHQRTMEMLKETMSIVANMNHTPSAAEKQKLEGMVKELDEMMKMEMHHGDGHHHGDKK